MAVLPAGRKCIAMLVALGCCTRALGLRTTAAPCGASAPALDRLRPAACTGRELRGGLRRRGTWALRGWDAPPRMSVGESIQGAHTVDGSGSFDTVRVRSPHDADTILLSVLPAADQPPADGSRSVALLPGFGWGEGSHPSTYMCLQFVCDEVVARGECTVMDYGTGSGVLALAAAAMGAQRTVGVDKDDEILEHAAANAEFNSLDNVAMVNGRDVMVGSSGLYIGDDHVASNFDVTVANMLPAALVKLSPSIAMSVKEDSGVLALCGCNRDEVESVKAAFTRVGIRFTGERRKTGAAPGAPPKEYVLLTGTRPAASAAEKEAMIRFLSDSAAT